jgi:hypothetical protein
MIATTIGRQPSLMPSLVPLIENGPIVNHVPKPPMIMPALATTAT